VAGLIYIPTNSVQEFVFATPHPLQNLLVFSSMLVILNVSLVFLLCAESGLKIKDTKVEGRLLGKRKGNNGREYD
jgi:hypothetical protein